MNTKKTYILFIAVFLVWGIIGYKIYKKIHPKRPKISKQTGNYKYNPTINTDNFTFTLHTNYRDPFLGEKSKKRNKPVNRAVIKPNNKKKLKEKPFPKLIYRGLVNPKKVTGKSVFMIDINGKSELFKIGQETSGVKLIKGSSREVLLRFQDSIQKVKLKF